VLLTAAESEQKLKSKIDGCATREETLQQRIKKKGFENKRNILFQFAKYRRCNCKVFLNVKRKPQKRCTRFVKIQKYFTTNCNFHYFSIIMRRRKRKKKRKKA